MSQSIWKYEFETTDTFSIVMKLDAEILCVQTQDGQPCIWAMVNTGSLDMEERYFEIFATGHPIKNETGTKRKYIGTYQLRGGALVFHLFERIQ